MGENNILFYFENRTIFYICLTLKIKKIVYKKTIVICSRKDYTLYAVRIRGVGKRFIQANTQQQRNLQTVSYNTLQERFFYLQKIRRCGRPKML